VNPNNNKHWGLDKPP